MGKRYVLADAGVRFECFEAVTLCVDLRRIDGIRVYGRWSSRAWVSPLTSSGPICAMIVMMAMAKGADASVAIPLGVVPALLVGVLALRYAQQQLPRVSFLRHGVVVAQMGCVDGDGERWTAFIGRIRGAWTRERGMETPGLVADGA